MQYYNSPFRLYPPMISGRSVGVLWGETEGSWRPATATNATCDHVEPRSATTAQAATKMANTKAASALTGPDLRCCKLNRLVSGFGTWANLAQSKSIPKPHTHVDCSNKATKQTWHTTHRSRIQIMTRCRRLLPCDTLMVEWMGGEVGE